MALSFRLPPLMREVPPSMRRTFALKLEPGMAESMVRRGEAPGDIEFAAFNAFLWTALLVLPLALSSLFLLPYPYTMLSIGLFIAPLLLPMLVLAGPSKRFAAEQRSYLIDTPVVIGAMGMSMNRSASLERAVEMGSRSGNGALQSSLASVAWKALTGEVQDLRRGLSAWTTGLGACNEGLRRSLQLVMAAEEEGGEEGRHRLLDRANSLALEWTREVCERYVGSLSFPVMLVFSFGVLAPVMLFSLVPLMGMEAGTASFALDLRSLALLLLVLVPAFTLGYIRSMAGRNPLRTEAKAPVHRGPWMFLAFLSAPAAALGMLLTGSLPLAAIAALAILLAALIASGGRTRKTDRDREASFVDGLYRLGNAMLGGQDLDAAFEEVARTEQGAFRSWALRMVHSLRTDRVSLARAVRDDPELREWSPVLYQNYVAVMECAEEDHRGAGKLAVNLAQSLGDLARTKRKVRENLRPVVDMMSATSVVFAPAIIGLTSGIMGLIGGDTSGIMALAAVYVVELAFVVNYFLVSLDEGRGDRGGYRSYGTRGALALGAFLIASLCGQTLLFRLL